jgi:hypothetical protein
LVSCFPYKDPIWGEVTIYDNGEIRLKGKKSTIIPPTPAELGLDEFWDIDSVFPWSASISDRIIPAPGN